MSLSKTLEEIKKITPYVTEDVEAGPRETLAGRRGRQHQAINRMRQLRSEYTIELRNSAAFILVLGNEREAFVTTAKEKFKCFGNDPDSFFVDLINRIPEQFYLGGEGLSNVFDILGRHLEDKMLALLEPTGEYNQLIFRQEYRRVIKTKKDFLALVKQAITETIGGELVGINAAAVLADEAIKAEHSAKFTPILLPSGDEKFALKVAADIESRMTRKVYIVSVGRTSKLVKDTSGAIIIKDASDANVESALKTIAESLRK